jgi:hypothetical protein
MDPHRRRTPNITAYVDVESAEPESSFNEVQVNSDLTHVINALHSLNRGFELPRDYFNYSIGNKAALLREMATRLNRSGAGPAMSSPDGIANVPKSRPCAVAIRGKDSSREDLLNQLFRNQSTGVYLDEGMKQELASFLIGKVRSTHNRLEEFEARYQERGNRYCELSK